MIDLSPGDFGVYFKAIHGREPFPWQARLFAQVLRDGCWPALLDLPTGTGKTAAIDVAVFHLAIDAARSPTERKAPRRIVMVVDRRTVVDQAFERAKKIARELHGAAAGVLKVVADALRSLGDTDVPLALAQLRGGMPRDDAWAKRPDQPLVAVSTVDQVGSRLLFRGYGVSEAMRPIHAGLLGNDTLLLLDEVHLSEPFRQALVSVKSYRGWAAIGMPDRWQVVVMSATPGREAGFGLNDDDRRNEQLARRLAAKKPAERVEVKVSGSEAARRAMFASECAKHAVLMEAPGRAVGVIVNRVASAREVFTAIKKHPENNAEVFLVTGRMRPLDRDDLDKEIGKLVRSERARDAQAKPVVVVSTQCIEAGADFDFDALVSECASLDALRQRFGRLNRLGAIEDARGVVLVRSDTLKEDDDPIYGKALAATWQWLGEGTRDFGIDAMAPALPAGDALSALLPPPTNAPVMLPAHLDAWVQTKPRPVPDPDVALWLHGIEAKQAPEVQIVWRRDLSELLFKKAVAENNEDRERAVEGLLRRIEVCPPVGLESISVPIYAVQAWLQGEDAPDLADVEGRSTEEKEERRERGRRRGRLAVLWKGEDSCVIDANDPELRAGSTIVVPSSYGGVADRNWDPSSKAPVEDLGGRARWQQTRRPTLRLHPDVVDDAKWAKAPASTDSDDPDGEDRDAVAASLDAMRMGPTRPWLEQAVKFLVNSKKRPEVVRIEELEFKEENGSKSVEPGYLAVIARARAKSNAADQATMGDITTDGDDGSHTGVEVTLTHHMEGVATWAKRFAEGCGLPVAIAQDVELAARWHDAGKVDARFQRLLCGGSESRAAAATEPLAKSKIGMADHAARRRAAERSGYPRGTRHELSSVALLARHEPLLRLAKDRDLVLHLVASHHGWCRPFAPVAAADLNPVELKLDIEGTTACVSSNHGLEKLDSGIADRFWQLVERYGWFGLAWLEAILRLADHRRSEAEQRGDIDPKEAT